MNNIAICFVGTARSLEYTHINIKKNLVDSVGECDIFAFLAQNKHSSKFQKYIPIFFLFPTAKRSLKPLITPPKVL